MTKEQLKNELKKGKHLSDVLPISYGDNSMIYKGDWESSSYKDIVYIPDIDLNGISAYSDVSNKAMEIDDIIDNAYTKGEIIDMVKDRVNDISSVIFELLKWKHPGTEISSFIEELL